jgi:hypothetical protein
LSTQRTGTACNAAHAPAKFLNESLQLARISKTETLCFGQALLRGLQENAPMSGGLFP